MNIVVWGVPNCCDWKLQLQGERSTSVTSLFTVRNGNKCVNHKHPSAFNPLPTEGTLVIDIVWSIHGQKPTLVVTSGGLPSKAFLQWRRLLPLLCVQQRLNKCSSQIGSRAVTLLSLHSLPCCATILTGFPYLVTCFNPGPEQGQTVILNTN